MNETLDMDYLNVWIKTYTYDSILQYRKTYITSSEEENLNVKLNAQK